MRIKKANKNEYTLAEGVWVRNPCLLGAPSIDINNLSQYKCRDLLSNELNNIKRMRFDSELVKSPNVIICSDGYSFETKQKILASFPYKDVKIIGVNKTLAKWKLVGENAPLKRAMTYYLVNNPFDECMLYLPKQHAYYPNCVASVRTNPKFIEKYRGQVSVYQPTPEVYYSGLGYDIPYLDDYRNSISGAISLALKMNAKRILLFCCDDSFADDRPAAIKMENGLYQYAEQIKSQKIIDSQLYWLKRSGILIGDHSDGIKYQSAEYIHENDLGGFFTQELNE